MQIKKTILIEAPLSEVYGAYADIEGWKHVLPDVLDVNVLYDDKMNQEFTMTVERPSGAETVRSIRYLRDNQIEMFQPVPPPGVRFMNGIWNFKEVARGTEVEATRDVELLFAEGTAQADKDAKEGQFAEKLSGFLLQNLESFKKAVELKKK